MKKIVLPALLLLVFNFSCDVYKPLGGLGGFSEAEAAQAIREALNQGTDKGVGFLNRTDGFFGNEFYKILLPPDAKKIENTLRTIGMGSMVDKAILQINRAAEDA